MTSDDLRLFPGARVLVADDHEQHVELLDGYLTAVGHDCFHAYDGEEAVSIAKEFHPDCVVTGFMMPRMDGFRGSSRNSAISAELQVCIRHEQCARSHNSPRV